MPHAKFSAAGQDFDADQIAIEVAGRLVRGLRKKDRSAVPLDRLIDDLKAEAWIKLIEGGITSSTMLAAALKSAGAKWIKFESGIECRKIDAGSIGPGSLHGSSEFEATLLLLTGKSSSPRPENTSELDSANRQRLAQLDRVRHLLDRLSLYVIVNSERGIVGALRRRAVFQMALSAMSPAEISRCSPWLNTRASAYRPLREAMRLMHEALGEQFYDAFLADMKRGVLDAALARLEELCREYCIRFRSMFRGGIREVSPEVRDEYNRTRDRVSYYRHRLKRLKAKKKYDDAHREDLRKYRRELHAKHAPEVARKRKEKVKADPEAARIKRKRSYRKGRTKILARRKAASGKMTDAQKLARKKYFAEYYRTHKKAVVERIGKYREENRDLVNGQQRKRYAAKKKQSE